MPPSAVERAAFRRAPALFCALVLIGRIALSPAPAQNDSEIPKAIPVNPPKAIPVEPSEPRDPAALESGAGDAERPLAAGPEGDLFTYANLLFSQNHYELAARQYAKYLESYPDGMHAQEAWYRLGESFLNLSKVTEAEQAYSGLLKKFGTGKFSGFAAYRLGTLAFTKQKYADAVPYFRLAQSQAGKAEVQLAASYYLARCLQQTGRESDSVPLYEKVAATRENNPFWQRSLLALARLEAAAGRDEQALKHYMELSEAPGATHDARGEALVQAGLILSDEGKTDEANEMFRTVLALEDAKDWKPLARYGLIDNYYRAERYQDVIETYASTSEFILPEETRPKMFLMAANSFRYVDRFPEAIDLYTVIEEYYGDQPEGREAGYSKLIAIFNSGDHNLPRFADAYIKRMRASAPESPLIDKALLLKAESFFQNRNYDYAAAAYGEIRLENIPGSLRAQALLRKGFSEADSGDPAAAAATLTEFFNGYPQDPAAPTALAKRALAYKAIEDNQKAIEDFERIIAEHPDSAPAELAYQQAALLKGGRQDYEGMIRLFKDMLAKFPESKGSAEAAYWIGHGHYKLSEYENAIPYLNTAREQDPDEYFDAASLELIFATFYTEKLDALIEAIASYRNSRPTAHVPARILAWVGLNMFEQKKFAEAESYLDLASNPDEPLATRPEIWNYLGQARLIQKRYEPAIEAFDFYLDTTERPADRAAALLDKSKAHLGANQYEQAAAAAEEGLALQKEGRVNALLQLVLGDIEMAQGNFAEAAKKYIVPSQVFLDPQIQPEAMSKAILALEKNGQTDKANDIRQQLESQYPDYQPKEPDQASAE